MEDYDDRTEVACALMMGATFEKTGTSWCCFDDTNESSRSETGAWNFKVNAARSYLSTKGVFFDRAGNPVHRSIMDPFSRIDQNTIERDERGSG